MELSLPAVVSREEWLDARKALLVKEKELTNRVDALNEERRRLPMVRVDKDYTFDGPAGSCSLLEMFDDRLQLVVYHFMFAPDWDAGCPNCSGFVDDIGQLAHLNATGTTFALVSRAPLAKIDAFKQRMGWTFPWYSSGDGDFNYDMHVTFDESRVPLEYNYRSKAEWAGNPLVSGDQPFELHGLSCFLRDGAEVFHTYSSYGRGLDLIGATANLLDRTALGRQEDWEQPPGRNTGLGAAAGTAGVRYRDQY